MVETLYILDGMIVAGLVVETLPDKAAEVAARLAAEPGVEVTGSNEHGVAITWAGESREEMERLAERLTSGGGDVTRVYPAYVGGAEEEGESC